MMIRMLRPTLLVLLFCGMAPMTLQAQSRGKAREEVVEAPPVLVTTEGGAGGAR
jgi:hypothetical protein